MVGKNKQQSVVVDRFQRINERGRMKDARKRRRLEQTEDEHFSEDEDQPVKRKSRRSKHFHANDPTSDSFKPDEKVCGEVQTHVSTLFQPPFAELCEESLTALVSLFRDDPSCRVYIIGELLGTLRTLVTAKRTYRKFYGYYKSPYALPFILFIQASAKKDLCINHEAVKKAHSVCEGIVNDFVMHFLEFCSKNQDDAYRKYFTSFIENLCELMWSAGFPAACFAFESIARLLIHIVVNATNEFDVHIRMFCVECIGILLNKMKTNESRYMPTKKIEEGFDKLLKMVAPERTQVTFVEKKNMVLMFLISCLSVKCTKSYCSVQDVANFYSTMWFSEAIEEANAAKNTTNTRKSSEMKKSMDSLLYFLHKMRACASPKAVSLTMFTMEDAEWITAAFISDRNNAQLYRDMFEAILRVYVGDEATNLRSKACRIASDIVEKSPAAMSIAEVDRVVKWGLADSASVIRSASLDLMSKVFLCDMENFDSYFPYLLQASRDGALCVRKKAIGIIGEICKSSPAVTEVTSLLVCTVSALRDEETTVKIAAKKLLFGYFFTSYYVNQRSLRAVIFAETFNLCRHQDSADLFEEFLRILQSDDLGDDLSTCVDDLIDALVTNFAELSFIKAKLELTSNDNSLYAKYCGTLIETVQVLPMIAECFPNTFLKYVDVISPFLTLNGTSESKIISGYLLSAFEASFNQIDFLSSEFMNAIDKLLITHLQTYDANGNMPALRCLALLGKHGQFSTKLFTLFLTFLREANIARLAFECRDIRSKSIISKYLHSPNFDTVLILMGRIASFFNIDLMLFDDSTAANSLYVDVAVEKDAVLSSIFRNGEEPYFKDVFSLLETFAFSPQSPHVGAAFQALGFLTAPYPKYLLEDPLRSTYIELLTSEKTENISMKKLVLQNLNVFVDRQSEKIEEHSQKEEGTGNRNPVMRDLLMSVQLYWNAVKSLIFSPDYSLRLNAAKLISSIVGHRLVVPHNSASLLVTMVADSMIEIRVQALKCLKSLDHLLAQNEALQGVRGSYKLLKVLSNNTVVRGYKKEVDYIAVLDAYYKQWQSERTVRRNIFVKLVAVFNPEDVHNSDNPASINEILYVADNLAAFSYTLMDEPLFIIKSINDVLRRNGTVVLQEFEQVLKPSADDSVEELSAKSIFERLPEDRSLIVNRYKNLVKISLLRALRNYLIQKYSLKEKDIVECRISVSPKIGNILLTKKTAGCKQFTARFVDKYLEREGTEQGWRIVAQHFAHAYSESLKESEEECI